MKIIYFLLLILSIAFLPFLVSIRMRFLYRKFGFKVPLIEIYKIALIVFGANTMAPLKSAGIFIRPFFFKKKFSVPYKVSILLVGLENMFDIILQLAAALICAYSISFSENLTVTNQLVTVTISFVAIFFLFFEKRAILLVDVLFRVMKKLTPKRILRVLDKKFSFKKEQFFEVIKQLQNKEGRLIFIIIFFLLSLLIVVYSPVILYFFYLSYPMQISFVQAFILYWVSFVLGRVSGIPGGLGVKDGAIVFILTHFGIPLGEAVTSTIVLRVVVTTVNVSLGIIASSTYGINLITLVKKKFRKKVS